MIVRVGWGVVVLAALVLTGMLFGAVNRSGSTAAGTRAVVVANAGDNTLSVISTATDRVLATVSTGREPRRLALSPDRAELWVTLYKDRRLEIFSAVDWRRLRSLDLDASPADLAFSADGTRLYVTLPDAGAVAVVDPRARRLVARVRLGGRPHAIRERPGSSELYVTDPGTNRLLVLSANERLTQLAALRPGRDPYELAFSADGAAAYVSLYLDDAVAVIDSARQEVTAHWRSGKLPSMLLLAPGDEAPRLWVAANGAGEVWALDEAGAPVGRLLTGGATYGIVATPDGKLYAGNSTTGTVSVISAASGEVLVSVGVGANPAGLLYVPAKSGSSEYL